MNKAATAYIDDLLETASLANRDLAIRCLDMAEGAANGLLLNESLTPALHAKLIARLKEARASIEGAPL